MDAKLPGSEKGPNIVRTLTDNLGDAELRVYGGVILGGASTPMTMVLS